MDHIRKNSVKLFDYAVKANLAGTKKELCEKIGLNPASVTLLKSGRQALTHDQLYNLVKLTGANVNWVYGFSKEMFIRNLDIDPINKIRQALAEIEAGKGKAKGKK